MLSCSLVHHPLRYKLSCHDALRSAFVSPYAQRHLELANHGKTTIGQRWGHRIIAAIEFIPVLGLLASLVERVVALFFHPSRIKECRQVQTIQPAFSQQLVVQGNAISPPSTMQLAVPLQISQTAATSAADIAAAEILVTFCELALQGFSNADDLLKQSSGLSVLEKAKAYRDWLSNPSSTENIEKIDLTNKNLGTIPPEISLFHNLLILNLGNNGLTALPPEIWTLKNLTDLDLSYNSLTSLPSEMNGMKQLIALHLDGNLLSSLPRELGSLKRLQYLYLKENQLTTLPSSIGFLKKLKFLHMQDNPFTSLPASMSLLPSPCQIFISPVSFTMPAHGNINIVPQIQTPNALADKVKVAQVLIKFFEDVSTQLEEEHNICGGRDLIDRVCSFDVLQKAEEYRKALMDPEIADVTTISISDLEYEEIPPEIGLFRGLESLDLSVNKLTSLPKEIWTLENLWFLDLQVNNLTTIPPEIKKLKKLQELILDENQIMNLPDEIGSLRSLTTLHINQNALSTLPTTIGNLQNLEMLSLYSNPFNSLPTEISNLPVSCKVRISANLTCPHPMHFGLVLV